MWRAFFLAIGIYLIIFGLECLAVDRVFLKVHEDPPPATAISMLKAQTEGPPKQFSPAGWVPWSLISCGAVVCLYSFTIPRRMAGK
jgi:hypothetical protein